MQTVNMQKPSINDVSMFIISMLKIKKKKTEIDSKRHNTIQIILKPVNKAWVFLENALCCFMDNLTLNN